MTMRRHQRGFLLNPFRFAGTTQSGAFSMASDGVVTLDGAARASANVSSIAEATVTMVNGQAASGAISMTGASVATLVGAGSAASALTSTAAASVTIASSANLLTVDAADFDGTDYLSKGAGFTGNGTNSGSGILSFWIDMQTAGTVTLFEGYNLTSDNVVFKLVLSNSGGNMTFQYTNGLSGSSSTTIATGAWHHFIHDFASGAAYLDGVSVGPFGTGTISYSTINRWYVMANESAGQIADGAMAELYFAPTQSIDLSVAANRERWRSSTGKPVNLGSTGSTPTGTAPIVYLHLDDGETANNFAINRGTGGNLTVTGALGTFGSSPSD